MGTEQAIEVSSLEEPTSDLEKYAQEVLTEMIREGIPPTPSNFDAFFDKLLDSREPAFRKRILKLLELEDGGDDEHHGAMERRMKEAVTNIKTFLQNINLLYKNLRHLETVIEKRLFETNAIADKGAMSALLEGVKKDLKMMNDIIRKDAGALKENYAAASKLVKEIAAEAVFDDRFGVYKKNYLLKKMRREMKLIKEFRNESSLMTVRIGEAVVQMIQNPKVLQLILRTVARLLLKTSRRSDVVAHYDQGIFAILMRHTSLDNAKKAAERLEELVHNSNFFVGDEEIHLSVIIGIARLDLDRTVEQTIVCALDALDLATEESPCQICSQDIEAPKADDGA